jgi:PiT family inorganic phosphate transporter
MELGLLSLVLASCFGFLMAWGVGANDLANIMSTTMGSKAITIRQAILIAIIFEFAGAFIGGVQVSDTVRNGIIDVSGLLNQPEILIYGMLAVLLAGTTWMLVASIFGLPVSITHTIIGAIVGFGSIVLGAQAIHWHTVSLIAISWITSPLLAGLFSFLLFTLIQVLIFTRLGPFHHAKRYAPLLLFLIGIAMATASILRGLSHLGFHIGIIDGFFITVGIGLLVMFIGSFMINRITPDPYGSRHDQFGDVEKIFCVLMFFTACAMVFAHGSNDVAIAVGPIAAIAALVKDSSQLLFNQPAPMWIPLLVCTGVVVGLLMYGRNVMATVGTGITALTPSRAFAATLAAAFTVVVATGTGIPVSTTQTLVGGVLGVGLARGIGALNMVVVRNIFMSWVITLPAAALFAMGYFYLIRFLFHL